MTRPEDTGADTAAAPRAATVAELTAAMLRPTFFVALSCGKGLDLRPRLAEHLAYMIDLERRGLVFASGPFGDGRSGDGMTILRAADEAQARAIMQADPFVVHGLRTFTLTPWTVMEGSLGVTVSLSQGTATVS